MLLYLELRLHANKRWRARRVDCFAHGLSCALLDRVALISPPSARLVFCCVFLHLNLPSDHFTSTFFSSLYPRQPLSLLSRSVTNSCYLDTTQLRKQAFTIVSPGQSPTCCPLPQTLQLSQVRHIRKSTHQLAVLRRRREPNPPTHHHAIRHATITAGRARGAASIMYSRPCASSGCGAHRTCTPCCYRLLKTSSPANLPAHRTAASKA